MVCPKLGFEVEFAEDAPWTVGGAAQSSSTASSPLYSILLLLV